MSPRPLPGPRLARLLALVPFVLAHPGTPLAELAGRFGTTERELERDLELLPLCGLPPYTADRLIDVWVAEDGAVEIRLAEYFERPLRLTPGEGVTILAAGRALLGVPGADPAGPLARALAKLEHALDARGALAVDVGAAARVPMLREAAAAGRQLELGYYSYSRDEMTTRVVDPRRVFFAFGAWYLEAYCHRAVAERLFRVDRIRSARPTGVPDAGPPPATAADDEQTGAVFRPHHDDLRVRLRLTAGAEWVVESVPVEDVTPRRGGGYEVVLAIGGPAFLDRLLLTLGPDAQVVEPVDVVGAVQARAAAMLARYS